MMKLLYMNQLSMLLFHLQYILHLKNLNIFLCVLSHLKILVFFLLELILTGSLLIFFFRSIAAIFTSEPHYWRAFLWCLGGAVVYRIVSLVRVILLANRIKSDAAYLLLRLACKPQKK